MLTCLSSGVERTRANSPGFLTPRTCPHEPEFLGAARYALGRQSRPRVRNLSDEVDDPRIRRKSASCAEAGMPGMAIALTTEIDWKYANTLESCW